jgi:hypothetical protein
VSKLGVNTDEMMKKLWGESFFNSETKEWGKEKSEGDKRSFGMHVLDPIYMVFDAIINLTRSPSRRTS